MISSVHQAPLHLLRTFLEQSYQTHPAEEKLFTITKICEEVQSTNLDYQWVHILGDKIQEEVIS